MDEELVLLETIETIEEAQEEAVIAQEGENIETLEADAGVAEFDSELDNDSPMEETTLDVLDVETVEEIEIEVDEAIGWVPGDSSRHYSLYGRDEDNQHPISAITGLKERLDEIEKLKVVESNGANVANYYKWEDNKAYDEHGYFVSLTSNSSEIKICDGSDIFGVSVDAAGFIGRQDATVPRDNHYGLIVTSGLVDVRCELDINVGDCVVSNAYGWAKKADSNYGYKVLARANKNGVEYAVIALGVQADIVNELGMDLDETKKLVDANYTNIISAVNVANQAYNKVSEIDASNKTMSEKVDGAVGIVGNLSTEVENLSKDVSTSVTVSTQAKAIAESAATSAESMKNSAVADANKALTETSKLREEMATLSTDMNTKLDNSVLELEAVKESVELTKSELQTSIADVSKGLEEAEAEFKKENESLSKDLLEAQKSIEDGEKNLKEAKEGLEKIIGEAVEDIESLEKDLIPLKTWPEGSTGDDIKGIAGFVAHADENGVTLGNLVAWKDGTGDESLAGFVSKATSENAEIKALAAYTYKDKDGKEHKSVAALDAYADENKAAIDAIVGVGGSLAGIQAQVDKNAASVSTLSSHVVGEYTSIEEWDATDKDTSKIYYAEDTRYYWYYDEEWKSTDKPYEAGLTGALAGIQQTADDNAASIEMITGLEGEFGTSLAGLVSKTTAENAHIKALAEYKYKDNDGKEHTSVAALDAYADDNKASIEAIVGKDGMLAGLQAQVDDNKASVSTLASQTIGDYVMVDTWSDTDKNTATVYYAKDKKDYYYYKDSKWVSTKNISETGLDGSIAGVKSVADANKAELDTIASYEKDGKKGLAGLTAQVDANKSELATVASYKTGDTEGLAGLVAQVDANKSELSTVASYEKDGAKGLAGLKAQVDENKSELSAVASYKKGNVEGLAGLVAQVDENKSELSTVASYSKNGKTGLAGLSAYVDEHEASVSTLAQYSNDDSGNSGVAGLVADVDDNTSTLSAVVNHEFTKNDGTKVKGLAGLNAYVNENESNVSLVADRVAGKYTVIDTWSVTDKNTNTIYYAKDTKLYWYYDNNIWKSTNDAYTAGLPYAVAGIQVVTDDHSSSINSLTSWQGDTNTAMARIEQKADANGAYIQSTVSNMDRYSVGPHSQAYGFTLEQAGSVLEEGMIYVPTESVAEEYNYTGSDGKTQTYERTFTPQYLYKWGRVSGQYRWITVDKNYEETTETNTSSKAVYFTTAKPTVSGNFGYWYTNGSAVTSPYEPYTLYKLESYVDEKNTTQRHWVAVATLAGNSSNRAVSQVRQDANVVKAEVVNARGSFASLSAKLSDTDSTVNTVATWKDTVSGDVSKIASIEQKANDNSASIGLVVTDGKANGSLIIGAINGESVAKIEADRLDIEGKTLNIKVDATNITGTLTIGQLPTTVAETSDIPTKTSELANDSGFQNETGVVAIAKGAITADYIKALNLEVGNQIKMGDNATISWEKVTGTGEVASKNDVKTEISESEIRTDQINVTDLNAFGATIGGWTIDGEQLKSIDGNRETVGIYSGTDWYLMDSLVYENKKSPARFFCGGVVSTTGENHTVAAPFMVLSDGSLYAKNAFFYGDTKFVNGDSTGNLNSSDVMTISDIKNGIGLAVELQKTFSDLERSIEELKNANQGLQNRIDELESKEEPTFYAITFNANGGSGNMPSVAVQRGTRYSMPENRFDPPSERTFVRWSYDAEGDDIPRWPIAVYNNITIYAVWREQIAHRITFNAAGGTCAISEMDTGLDGKLVELPEATRDDYYTFVGWYTKAVGGEQVTSSYVFAKDTTIYAHWIDPTEIAVVFDSNGGKFEDGSTSQTKIYYNEVMDESPIPTRPPYAFEGWNTERDGTGYLVDNGDNLVDLGGSNQISVYAQWTDEDGDDSFYEEVLGACYIDTTELYTSGVARVDDMIEVYLDDVNQSWPIRIQNLDSSKPISSVTIRFDQDCAKYMSVYIGGLHQQFGTLEHPDEYTLVIKNVHEGSFAPEEVILIYCEDDLYNDAKAVDFKCTYSS